jgi:hypothetical protein
MVLTTARDVVTFAEIQAYQSALGADPEFEASFNHLINTRDTAYLAISTHQAEMMASRSLFSASSRQALLVGTPPVFGVGRLLGVFRDPQAGGGEVRVFPDRDAALEWLR